MKVFLTFFMALVVQITFAQQRTVTGTVTDAQGMPLPAVNVTVQGTNTGTQTDFDGNYSVNAAEGQVLIFSFVGFSSETVTVGTSNVINVSLQEDAAELEEVVVLGYSTRGVEEVTGSSVQVTGAEVADVPVASVDQALQGRVAGLQISQSSGTPGSTNDIRIRGVGSLTAGNEPLFVINGVPINNNNVSQSDALSTLNPLAAINSQDIETITVLKDASATAAYGARGSNGVIVITTKSGKAGKTQFSVNSSIGFQNDAYNKRRPLNGTQRIELLTEALINSYGANGDIGDYGVTDIPSAIEAEVLNPVYGNFDGTDYRWFDRIANDDALTQNYTVSATGGDENGSFYASLGYNNTDATVIGGEFERTNGVLNFDRKLRDNVKFTSSVNVSSTVQNGILEQSSYFSNPFLTRFYMNPINNPENPDGTWNINLFGGLPNIFYVMDENINRSTLNRALGNFKVDWELFEGLTFSNRYALDYSLQEFRQFYNRYEGDGANTDGSAYSNDNKNFNWVYQGSLNYGFKLGSEHNFDVTALFEYQNNQNSFVWGAGNNFPTDGLTYLTTASANFTASAGFTDWHNVSYLGLLNYNFAGKYVVDATYRREGSSRFAQGMRFGDFGSVGVAWNMHREDFMRGSVFNTLRLRGSYGFTGNNEIGTNEYQALLSFSGDYAGNGAALPSQFGNPFLSWENGQTFDAGFEFGMFNNRLTGNFAYFNRRTYDLLQNVPLPRTSGFSEQRRNSGEMVNKGIEAQLGFDVIATPDFLWNINANYATVDNEVTDLALDDNGEYINPDGASVYKTTEIGLPAGAWYMRTWAGVDPQTGQPTWYVNGVDGETTSNYNAAERVYQGTSALPQYSGGFGTRIQWKGFFADANFYFAGGHKIYENFAQHYFRTNSFTLGSYNGITELMDRWQQPGDVTDVPRLSYATNDNFWNTSSRHLYDGDYIRLKNLAVGYSLPADMVRSMGVDGLTLTLRGTNIATWVKDPGLKLDPEVRAAGFALLTTPPVKTYSLGVNLKF